MEVSDQEADIITLEKKERKKIKVAVTHLSENNSLSYTQTFVIHCTAHGHILEGHVTGFIGSSCRIGHQVAPHNMM